MSMEAKLPEIATSFCTDKFGHALAVTMTNSQVGIYRASDLALVATITAPASPTCSSFSSKGKLAVGMANGAVIIYSVTGSQYRELKTLQQHSAGVSSVAFHAAGDLLATGSYDGTFCVHDMETGKCVSVVASAMGVSSLAWGTDTAGQVSLMTLFCGCCDGSIKIWKSAGSSWELADAVQAHNSWVRCMATPALPPGSTLKVASCGDDDTIVVALEGDPIRIQRIACSAVSVAWASVDKTIVAKTRNGALQLFKENDAGEWCATTE